ncbi:hypothetical protein LCGC14_3054450, partial [marine sediment metagenome]
VEPMARQALAATKQRKKKTKKRKVSKGELVSKEKLSYDQLVKKLPAQRRKFVHEYLVDLNGTRAAMRAGYSEKTANEQAAQLLANLSVSQAVEAGHQRLAELVKVRQYEIVREFRNLGFSDMRHFSEWGKNGVTLTDSKELTREQAACVAEVSQTITENGGTIKFKLHNKVDALSALAKHLGMFPTRVEQGVVQVPVQFNIVIRPTR